ncbi:Ger(x)C family spore germination protein [Cohnella panacarvi]|uniref:Ger(x)C family spore germination protein n=1 Tax=Cohnella panacarvi TaxID=400776 RepID=UPI0004B4AABE|nr:Ger(x)C family spore germination protein [Cohnella panacarvi]
MMFAAQFAKTIKLLIVIGMVVPVLTGCWDRLEIEERAVVLGISVDLEKPGAAKEESDVSHLKGAFPVPNQRMLRVAVQIALPGRIPLGPGEGGGGKGGSEGTVWVIDVVGHTLDDALMNLQQQVSGRLFFGHLRVIVVSEALARHGLQNLNDYLRRNPEVRRMAWMMVSKGSALEVMRAAPELERVPSLYLMSTLDNAVRLGKFPVNYVGMFWSNTSKKGQEAFLPYVEIRKEQNIQVQGMAIFTYDKMVGSTLPFDIAAYMGIKGLNPAGYRGFVPIGNNPSRTVTIYATSRKSMIKASIRNGKPYFKVSIFTEISMEEKISEQFSINSSDILKEIEDTNRKALKKACENLIEKTQKAHSDIFGFGEYVRAKLPNYWNKKVITKGAWQEMYPNVDVEVTVNTRMRRVGMKAK